MGAEYSPARASAMPFPVPLIAPSTSATFPLSSIHDLHKDNHENTKVRKFTLLDTHAICYLEVIIIDI